MPAPNSSGATGNSFGTLLRFYRERCSDSQFNKARLTQARFGELVGRKLGIEAGYTAAAVSEWELGKSKIAADDWRLLTSLIGVLHDCGGWLTPAEANALLAAGNYRPLNPEEVSQIFPHAPMVEATTQVAEAAPPPSPPPASNGEWRFSLFLGELVFRPVTELGHWLDGPPDEPPPTWSRRFLRLFGWPFQRWSSTQVLNATLWLGCWLVAWRLTFPIMYWPFVSATHAYQTILVYIGGALLTPLLVGGLSRGLSRTWQGAAWQNQPVATKRHIALFAVQGAYVGFQVGYMLIFFAALIGHYLGLPRLPLILEGLVAAWPLLVSAAAAREVPVNLLKAYGHLRLTPGHLIMLVAFVLFGPLWGTFFLWMHPILLTPALGGPMLVMAFGGLAAQALWQRRKR